jgi:hypothetical protein
MNELSEVVISEEPRVLAPRPVDRQPEPTTLALPKLVPARWPAYSRSIGRSTSSSFPIRFERSVSARAAR